VFILFFIFNFSFITGPVRRFLIPIHRSVDFFFSLSIFSRKIKCKNAIKGKGAVQMFLELAHYFAMSFERMQQEINEWKCHARSIW
jgi:hypothetical protein